MENKCRKFRVELVLKLSLRLEQRTDSVMEDAGQQLIGLLFLLNKYRYSSGLFN